MTAPTTAFLLGGDLAVSRLGFGAMRLTGQPGNFGPYPNWEAGKALLRRAVELGVTFFDTARAYGPGWNEELIADALAPYDGVVVATKGGIEKHSPTEIQPDGRPEALRRHVEESRRRLRLDTLPLYYLHRPDPAVPLLAQVEALAQERAAGRIRHVGLSNVTVAQLEAALAVVPVAAVQNRYNVAERGGDDVVDYTAARGIAFVPYGPLGANPMRPGAPLAAAAHGHADPAGDGRTPAQRALGALLGRAPNVLPIPGTTSAAHLEENVAAAREDPVGDGGRVAR
jgi:aryl-alcohol dehydrogenase-like predicted oxidoreductase